MNRGILAIVAHPDDETFGCGGILALHSYDKIPVYVLCMTCNPKMRREELISASMKLGVENPTIFDDKNVLENSDKVKRVADVIVDCNPSVVITHVPFDYHKDHRAAYELVKEAVEWAAHTTTYEKPCQIDRLLLMEVNSLISKPHILVDISSTFKSKIEATKVYTSQLSKFDWGYYERFNLKKAELRGVQGNCRYAEAFLEEPIPKNSPFYPVKTNKLLV
jgi:LmbE family N-acetylglucosaminyl deacetylase